MCNWHKVAFYPSFQQDVILNVAQSHGTIVKQSCLYYPDLWYWQWSYPAFHREGQETLTRDVKYHSVPTGKIVLGNAGLDAEIKC